MRRAYLGWIVFVGTIAIGLALVCFTKRAQAQAMKADFDPPNGDPQLLLCKIDGATREERRAVT
jgi:hypothetical protein